VQKLFSLNLVLLLQGQTVSRIGSAIASLALSLWVLETTGSATYVGLVMLGTSLPLLLFTPIGGVLADRLPRRTLLVGADTAAGLALLSLVLPFYVLDSSDQVALIWLVCALMVSSTAMAFFMPAIMAAIPDIAPKSRLDDANSLFGVVNSVTNVVGSGVAGLLFRVLGGPLLFILNGVTFLVSAFSELFLKLPPPEPRATEATGYWADTKEGLSYIAAHKGLRNLLLLFTASNFMYAPAMVTFPILVTQFHNQPPDWLGYIFGALGLGSMTGLALFTRVHSDGPGRFRWFTGCMVAQGCTLATLGTTPNGQMAVVVSFIAGIAMAPVNVMFMSVIQGTVPRAIVGRVSSVGTLITGASMPLGYAFGGIALDLMNRNAPLMLYLCGAGAATVAVWVSLNADYRQYMSTLIGNSHEDARPAGARPGHPSLDDDAA